jgi:methylase of polypeptide subunit release factors/predicted type IV restriction endonuclease
MAAPKEILELVRRFDEHKEAYKSGQYNETQLRREFLDPFFKALGWDIDNTQGIAEQYKDVIHEYSIKIGGNTKAPDYCFRIGGTRKFFLEAKKPAVDIKEEISPAYQLRRYAWSAKLPLSILSDFEGLAIYDCRIRPVQDDKASTARVFYCTYDQYAEKWDEIASIFSKDAILKGSFDKYAETNKRKKGTAEVDDVFLSEIESWREHLAQNIALRNPELSQAALNYSVQQTIDRIIFLRICEDRGIEPYGQLQALQNGANIYKRLCEIFHRADDRYNSGLFHFGEEKDRHEPPDRLTLGLHIDDKPLKEIFKNLYYPDSPYEFSVLGADILGSVYEQFLGKVIRLTPAHHAVVEDKPEVKKAGGVYYTPTYIVDYIVKHTVGKLVEGKKPKDVEKLRILDPACGSGSFLIGAYQYLMDWHLKWYEANEPEKHARGRPPRIYRAAGNVWRLTTSERKRILLNNIYGVDIDTQAVEVTKLSLLLKVLEGESDQSLNTQMALFRERALPDLGDNIKCGNSLIGPDFYGEMLLNTLDDDERRRINVFDWEKAFPEIMQGGGFDAVVGNPPYIRIQIMQEWAPLEVEYYKQRYASAVKGNYDIYVVFVERGLAFLNNNGLLGFILPHKFFNAQYGEPLRALLSKGMHLTEVVHFGDEQVFAGASTYTCLMFLNKSGTDSCHVVKVDDLDQWRRTGQAQEGEIPTAQLSQGEWHFAVGKGGTLLERLNRITTRLENVTSRIFQGIKTSADKIYIVEERERQKNRVKIYSPEKDAEFWLEPDLLHPLIKGGDSKCYSLTRTNRFILFPYARQADGETRLITEDVFKDLYPLTWGYLTANKQYLEDREHGKMRGPQWYAYGRSQALEVMPLPKIFTPDIAPRAAFSLDDIGDVFVYRRRGGWLWDFGSSRIFARIRVGFAQ